ncbi:MAG: electron transport complex, RnfABCDGE type, B subunit [uncultured bacterium]|nr:MAG: electron transport complex, RnfABCDGE type, B subunit [uncultured bacterium]
MLLLSVSMGYVLGWANKVFHVEIDPKIEKVNSVLPGVNCGGCGFVGCQEYAEAIVKTNAPITKCSVGGKSCAANIADIMGVTLESQSPWCPVIHCCSDNTTREGLTEYRGDNTCSGANMVAGIQSCSYGCLGFGDCKTACKYGAIKISGQLAVIDYNKCVGCSACAKACPRHIISMVPFKTNNIAVVACSNKDAAKETRLVCKVGCIACKACSKVNEHYVVDATLARLDYDKYNIDSNFDAAINKCPRHCIIKVGTPHERYKTEDEVDPKRVDADFSTTVDNTEWRG